MKFIHAADLHIDSPLRGLEQYAGAPVERLREATRNAFKSLVTLAIDEQVDFLVIAGDLFDGEWRDMQTGLWTANQFRRLSNANIPVYMLRGNHDAASQVRKGITWPENVHEFSYEQPETFEIPELSVALHGQGFATREVLDDLAAGYPPSRENWFNIGVLHTSYTGNAQHDTYAATSETVLKQKGYHYWAMGHVHKRETFCTDPWIGFSGNTQGRHIRETGAKGCLLVNVGDDFSQPSVTFRPLDHVRWDTVSITLTEEETVDDLLANARDRFQQQIEQSEGRLLALRLIIDGRCVAHQQLRDAAIAERARTDLHNMANDFGDQLWIEKIKLQTQAVVDRERLLAGNSLTSQMLQAIDQLRVNNGAALRDWHTPLDDLEKIVSATDLQAAGILLNDPTQQLRWLQQAEDRLISSLADEDEA